MFAGAKATYMKEERRAKMFNRVTTAQALSIVAGLEKETLISMIGLKNLSHTHKGNEDQNVRKKEKKKAIKAKRTAPKEEFASHS